MAGSLVFMKLRTRFALIVVFGIVGVLGVGFWVVQDDQERALADVAHRRASAILSVASASRRMVKESLRPAVSDELERFTPEAMSSTFVTRALFERLSAELPDYVYRQPTLNPLNPANKADEFEAGLIGRFRREPTLDSINGMREIGGRQCYFFAQPEVVEQRCLVCHGDPEDAPPGLVERYGGESGFGWKAGEIAGLTLVTVPIDDLLEHQASLGVHALVVFLVATVGLFLLILYSFDRVVNRRIKSACEVMAAVEARPDLRIRVPEIGRDELTDMAGAFNRMADSVRDSTINLEARVQERTRELENARDEAQQAERAKEEFLANMSHELRTPLTAILGYAEELEIRRDELPDSCAEFVRVIFDNGKHLMHLINDVLDLSKILAGHMEIESTDWSPFSVLEEVRSLMGVKAHQKGIELKVSADGPLPEFIRGDPSRTKQILFNLVGNAIKFTEKGGVHLTARFETDEAPGRLILDVEDSGIGMSAEHAARLFERFKQADTSTTRRFGGTGLGLDISRRLAGLLGGDLRLVRSEPGEGSVFRLAIPTGEVDDVTLVEETGEATREDMDLAMDAGLSCRVLVAEDNRVNQRIVLRILERFGAAVQVVANGRDAVDVALRAEADGDPFDVVLMDMHMPEMDGVAAIKELRARGYAHPIVVLTAAVLPMEQERCREAGCDAFATKPIDRRALFEILLDLTTVPTT